jgi:hypothetical protein
MFSESIVFHPGHRYNTPKGFMSRLHPRGIMADETNRPVETPRHVYRSFGAWLRAKLEEKEMTVYGLSQASGVSVGRIDAYVHNQSEPYLANARRICRALGYSLSLMDREIVRPESRIPQGGRL